MEIFVNGEQRDISDNTTLSTLLDDLFISMAGCAVAVNHCVIKRSTWGETLLNKGDKVTIIRATQGG